MLRQKKNKLIRVSIKNLYLILYLIMCRIWKMVLSFSLKIKNCVNIIVDMLYYSEDN